MRWFPLTLACVLAAAGCGSDEIEHDEFGGVGGEVGGVSFSTGVAFEGNFPEPAQSRCGPLPPDTPPLDGLMSAWGVLALPGARSADGVEIEPGTVRLRLGDHPLADCAQTFQPDEGHCRDAGVEGLECG